MQWLIQLYGRDTDWAQTPMATTAPFPEKDQTHKIPRKRHPPEPLGLALRQVGLGDQHDLMVGSAGGPPRDVEKLLKSQRRMKKNAEIFINVKSMTIHMINTSMVHI
jgi:hypothetical protein